MCSILRCVSAEISPRRRRSVSRRRSTVTSSCLSSRTCRAAWAVSLSAARPSAWGANAACRASRGWPGQAENCTTDTTSSTPAAASSRAERTAKRLPMPTRNRTEAGSIVRCAYLSAGLAATSPMGPLSPPWEAPAGGAATLRQHDHNPARSAGRGPRVFSGGRYRERPARRSPPRRALVPPRTEPRGANPYARRHRSHPPPDHRVAPFIENGCTSQKLRSRAGEKRGRRGLGARSIPSSTCSSDSGAAGDGVECVGERKLEARRDPYAGRPRLLEPTPVRRSAPAARAPPSTLIPTAASACRSI